MHWCCMAARKPHTCTGCPVDVVSVAVAGAAAAAVAPGVPVPCVCVSLPELPSLSSSDVSAVVPVRAESWAVDATLPAGTTACLPLLPASLFHPLSMDDFNMAHGGDDASCTCGIDAVCGKARGRRVSHCAETAGSATPRLTRQACGHTYPTLRTATARRAHSAVR